MVPFKILFVDDDDDERMFFKNIVNTHYPNALFEECNSKEQTVALLNSASSLPSIIFLDINMPVNDGFSVLQTIKSVKKLKHIPVIMFSTSSNLKHIHLSDSYGASGYAIKPDSLSQIQSIIDKVINHITKKVYLNDGFFTIFN